MPKAISRVDVTPGTPDSWEDVDITSHVGSDAGSIAMAKIEISGGSWGIRNNGSSDDRVKWSGASSAGPIMGWVSVDSGDIFEANIDTGETVFLLAYMTTAEAERFVNLTDILHSTDGAWTDIDITPQTSGVAVFAALEYDASDFSGSDFGLRKNGSTDDRKGVLGRTSHHLQCVALDGGEIFECWDDDASDSGTHLYLMGVLTDNFTAQSNGQDYSTGTTGSYQDTDVTPDVAAGDTMICVLAYTTNGQQFDFGIRRNGASNDNDGSAGNQRIWNVTIEIDGSDIFEQKIADIRQDLYLLGQFSEPSAGQSISPSPLAIAAAINAGVFTATGSAPIVPSPLAIVAALNAGVFATGGAQSIAPSPLAIAAAINAALFAATGSTPISPSPLAIVAAINAAVFAATGSAPISPSPLAIAAAINAGVFTATGSAPIVPSPLAIAAAINAAVFAATGSASFAPAPLAILVAIQTPTIAPPSTILGFGPLLAFVTNAGESVAKVTNSDENQAVTTNTGENVAHVTKNG